MGKYIFKRILLGLLTIVIITVMIFFLIHLSANKPFKITDYPTLTNADAKVALVKDLEKNGLYKNVGAQFIDWIVNLFHGTFGHAFGKAHASKSIPSIFFGPLKYTILITLPVLFLSIIIGISLGVVAGYKRGKWIDTGINFFVIFFVGIPSFVLAVLALTIGPKIGLPISFSRPEDAGWGQTIKSIILPVSVLLLTSLVGFSQYTRNMVITVLSSNYILIAKSKGMSSKNIFFRYVFRNISIPIVTLVIPSFLMLIGGSLVIETIFQVPGSSSVIVDSFKNSEYNIIMFQTLFFTTISIFVAILVDVVYVAIDPRIKYAPASKKSVSTRVRFAKIRSRNNQANAKGGN